MQRKSRGFVSVVLTLALLTTLLAPVVSPAAAASTYSMSAVQNVMAGSDAVNIGSLTVTLDPVSAALSVNKSVYFSLPSDTPGYKLTVGDPAVINSRAGSVTVQNDANTGTSELTVSADGLMPADPHKDVSIVLPLVISVPEGVSGDIVLNASSPDGSVFSSGAIVIAKVGDGTTPLAVTGLNPTSGPAAGGTPVMIAGTGFSTVSAVYFGSTAADSFSALNDTLLTAVSPPGSGTVDVTVYSPEAGASAANEKDLFTYSGPSNVGGSLKDIAGHWAESNINKLVGLGAVAGYPDGSFKPDNTITRAEFATILVKAFKLEPRSGKVFADTAGHWAKDYIATAAGYGIVNGYDATTFGPDNLITREQMAEMVVKAAKLEAASGETGFTDATDIAGWAKDSVAAAVKAEVIKGYPDNTFKPKDNATRAEAVTVIANALK